MGIINFCFIFAATLTARESVSLPARVAEAAPPASHVALLKEGQSLALMQQMLHMLDEEIAQASLRISWANVGVGVANLVGASFVTHRGAHGAAVGAYTGGAAALLTGIMGLTLGHRPFHSVVTGFCERQHSMPAAQVVVATERDWQARAASLRQLRKVTGSVLTGVGTVMVGLTTANLILGGPYPSASTQTNDRAAFGGALLGLSGLIFVNGVTLLSVPGPIETSWHVYTALHPPSVVPRATVGVVPARGGITAVAALHF